VVWKLQCLPVIEHRCLGFTSYSPATSRTTTTTAAITCLRPLLIPVSSPMSPPSGSHQDAASGGAVWEADLLSGNGYSLSLNRMFGWQAVFACRI
jgi:hypothetical protein